MADIYCKEKVFSPGDFRGHQCTRRGRYDGYCSQHHPQSRAQRDAERQRHYDRQSAILHWEMELDEAHGAVIEAAKAWLAGGEGDQQTDNKLALVTAHLVELEKRKP